MNYIVLMNENQSLTNLPGVIFHFNFGESFSFSDYLAQSGVLAEFGQDVHVVIIVEMSLELNYVLMI